MPKKNSGARKKLEKEKASQPKVNKPKEDKTFGLKNKNKSKKVQQYVEVVKKQESQKSKEQIKDEKQKEAAKAAKAAKKEMEQQMSSLFKAVVETVKVDPNVDPKSILCPHFKAGLCKFGKKCKHSHDMNVERKSAKINLYVDPRELEADTMENWDQAKLESVLAQKERGRQKENETKIVCKYFVEALENYKYGWLWKCPNGVNCIYKHALPPGFKLKRDIVKDEDKEEEIMEEKIEELRAKLDLTNCTPITLERFKAWKAEKAKKAEEERLAKVAEEKKAVKKGPYNSTLSGRDLFTYDPSVFVDDISAGGAEDYVISGMATYDIQADEQPDDDDDGHPKEEVEPEKDNQGEGSDADEQDKDENNTEGGGGASEEPTKAKKKGKKKKKKKSENGAAEAEAGGDKAVDAAPIDESLFLDDLGDLPDE